MLFMTRLVSKCTIYLLLPKRFGQKFNDNAVDWSPLKPAIPRGGVPCDIDGFLEINSHFLFIEAEKEGKKRSVGQDLALVRLSMQPRMSVLIVEWSPYANNTEKHISKIYKIGHSDDTLGAGWHTLRDLVESWCQWAERQ